MDRGGRKWGFTEVSIEDQIPYVGREKCAMYGTALEEKIGDNIWKWDRAREFKAMRHGSDSFKAILG